MTLCLSVEIPHLVLIPKFLKEERNRTNNVDINNKLPYPNICCHRVPIVYGTQNMADPRWHSY